MDPISILMGLKATHEVIKACIAEGKDIVATAQDLSSLMGDVAKLTSISSEQPKGWKNKGSAEEQALIAFTARKEAEEIQRQVRSQIVSVYGLHAWDSILKEVAIIKKAQQAEAERKRRKIEKIVDCVLITVIILFACIFLGTIAFLAVSVQKGIHNGF